ncbi:MAG: c-type cytochrome, partial [Gemmataceae bacterium]|nr:c-type cytochrome [Gemmataceae bacterium]
PHPGVREVAVRLAKRVPDALANDPDPRVRFVAACRGAGLERLAARKDNDSWTEAAILSSARGKAAKLLAVASPSLRPKLAALVGAGGTKEEIAAVLASLDEKSSDVLDGLARGVAQAGRSLGALRSKEALALFDKAALVAMDRKKSPSERAAALGLLSRGPKRALAGLLAPSTPPEVQLATVRALSAWGVAAPLVEAWASASPSLRREMGEALMARPERIASLIEALETKRIMPVQLEPARLAQLRKLPDAALRKRAEKALASALVPARAKVVKDFEEALSLKGDAARGAAVFAKHCAACHKLDGVGKEVGADLLAALRNKTADALLIDILDPSREVDPRYLSYTVTTKRGLTLTGILSADTATSLTLRRGEGAEDTVLRSQVEKVESTGKSLMPEGFEAEIGKRAMADLIAYLLKPR